MSKRGWIILGGGAPLLALIALLAWGSIGSGGNPGGALVNSEPGEERISARQAPQLDLMALRDGREITTADLQGRVVLIDFWSSWCPPCRAEMPGFQRFYDEYSGRVTLLGLDVGPFTFLGSNDQGKDLLRQLGIT